MSTGTDEISRVGGAKIVIYSLGTIFPSVHNSLDSPPKPWYFMTVTVNICIILLKVNDKIATSWLLIGIFITIFSVNVWINNSLTASLLSYSRLWRRSIGHCLPTDVHGHQASREATPTMWIASGSSRLLMASLFHSTSPLSCSRTEAQTVRGTGSGCLMVGDVFVMFLKGKSGTGLT